MGWFEIALAVALSGGVAVLAVGIWKRPRGERWRLATVDALLWVWAWGVLAMTFGTRSGGGSAINVALLDITNRADVVDFGLNALMFAPAGILLAVRPAPLLTAVLVGLGGSLSIEIAQYDLATGRTADANDLIANSLGCLGAFFITAGVLNAVGRRRQRTSTSGRAVPLA